MRNIGEKMETTLER